LDRFAEGLIAEYRLPSLALGVIQGGELSLSRAYGFADLHSSQPANIETIYAIASCSKAIVGLAAVKLKEMMGDELNLGGDVNDWLAWPEPLLHPDFPDQPVTLRQLLTHKAGIISDSDADYESYPKPDPDMDLDPFLQDWLLRDESWLESAPGEEYAYSNLGVALAALVLEKAAGQEFRAFCNEQLFEPMGMKDSRWSFSEFNPAQQARIARPHDDLGEPLEHYGFNDYPSGLLRTTLVDLSNLMRTLMADGHAPGGRQVLKPESITLFEEAPLIMEPEEWGGARAFSHDGGEAGVISRFIYREDGLGYLYFVNGELEEDDLESFQERLNAWLRASAEGSGI